MSGCVGVSLAHLANQGERITMNQIGDHPQGCVLEVKVHAGARRNQVRLEEGDLVKIAVTQAAEKGKANQAVLELLADTLGIRPSQLEILSGQTSPRKRILVRELPAEEVRQRLVRGRQETPPGRPRVGP